VSFCSSEEKQQLAEIEKLINKKIDTIKVSKTDYKAIIAPEPEEIINEDLNMSFSEMIEQEEARQKQIKKSKNKAKKSEKKR
jgi:hypothetical protein